MKPPYAIGSVPSLSGHAVAYRWRSLPRVRRHRASKPQGSSERVLPWQITMDQLIFASLSHTHYWYEVGMLKVPACCWPYLIGQHQLSPVFGQMRTGTPGNSYFPQLPPVFGHFLFRFWPFYVPFRWATRLLEQINMGQNFAQVTWRLTKFPHFLVNNFGSSQLYPYLSGGYSGSFITPARTTTRTSTVRQGDA